MNLSEYANYDAIGLGQLVAAGEIRAADLAALARAAADSVNPRINAVVEHWVPEEADLSKRAVGSPLAGVPFLIKDLAIQMAGRRNELGSRLARGLVASTDSNLMRHFRKAGLVTVGRTTTPEMAFSTETESTLQGATGNPWNTSLSAGGSSGGSGAAVAAGVVPMAHATDAAGSIRVPAAHNGLFGLKPTRGRTSNGPALDEVFAGLGVQLGVSRTVRDSAALMDAVQGHSMGDPYYTAAAPTQGFLAEVGKDPGKLRIGVMVHAWNSESTDAVIARAASDTALHLESLGHQLEEASPELGVSWEAFVHANAQIWCATLVRWIDGLAAATGRPIDLSTLEPSTLANYRYGRSASAVDFAAALEVRNSVARAVGDWFSRMDVLLTPTLPRLPGTLGTYSEGAERMDGLDWTARVFRHTPFTPPANVAGTPAMSVPLFSAPGSGLPIGMQFMAGFAREDLLLRLAGQLEQSMPWIARRPPVWAGNAQVS